MSDNISRKAAIDAIQKALQGWGGYALEDYRRGLYKAQDILEALPSTDRNGQWTLTPMLPDNHRYECSNCKRHHRERYDFCPSCGADMRGERNE